MLLYFPQDTPVELGPTAIMPVTHAAENNVTSWLAAAVTLPAYHAGLRVACCSMGYSRVASMLWRVQGSQYLLQYDMRPHGMNDVKLSDELPCAGPAGKHFDHPQSLNAPCVSHH